MEITPPPILNITVIIVQLPVCYKLYSRNKNIGDLKTEEQYFLPFFAVKGVVLRGAWNVPNFLVATLYALNCIPTIKLLAISKTTELEFFLEKTWC